ncbi:MAG: hypothetical protein HY292_02200 [Planctomycetes bacterium]|nr:hypothetical protein [Planctomycetota bacterium]
MSSIMRHGLCLASLVVGLGARAAEAQQQAPPCSTAEYRQFDFWLGDWNVYSGDQLVGANIISSVQGQCALLENWTDATGHTGMSINFYDRSDRLWHQTWISQGGGALFLKGEFKDGKMVLVGDPIPGPNGVPVINRITWSALDGGRVRQLWDSSTDGGKTWAVAFDGTYVRKRDDAASDKPKKN